jgi:antitoxin component YwqK of YwqJK toxin-antitoxin module
MKQILRILLTLLPMSVFAQTDEEPEYKAVVIHYNANWEVTKPETAVAKRLTYFSNDIKAVPDLSAPLFQNAITDYYANNVIMAKGFYNAKGQKWGKWVFYHPNGRVDCEGNFSEDAPSGKWAFWTPTGEPLMDVTLEGEKMLVHNFWSEAGEQLIKDGAGVYTALHASVNGKGQSTLQGTFANGYKTGWWRLTDAANNIELEQLYDSKGEFFSGKVYVNGAPTVSKDDLITLVSLPDYLLRIENWATDSKHYPVRYPIAAELLGWQISRVESLGTKTSPAGYHYLVVQHRANGQADTLQHGVQAMEASFKGDLMQYALKNFKAPSPHYMLSNKIEGLLVIKFTVAEDGRVLDPVVVKSVHPKIDEEGLRVVNTMPAWNPAIKYGKPVASEVFFPMRFKY